MTAPETRLDRIRERLELANVDALLVTNPHNGATPPASPAPTAGC